MYQKTVSELIERLNAIGISPNLEHIREALWLASVAPPIELPNSVDTPSKPSSVGTSPAPTGAASPQPVEREDLASPNPFAGTRNDPAPAPSPDKPGPTPDLTPLYPFAEVDPQTEAVKASPIPVPAASALPSNLPLSRAMRPFSARWPSSATVELDEEATVEATAELGGMLTPVTRRMLERWYEVHLVFERTPSMLVWLDTVSELRSLLFRTGVFRDVRAWRFEMESCAAPVLERAFVREGLMSGALMSGANDPRIPARHLASRNSRRLILFCTHGISNSWLDGSMADVFAAWREQASVAIIQMMPAHLWGRTALGEPEASASAIVPGAVGKEWRVEIPWWSSGDPGRTAVPIVPIDSGAILNWALAQMGRGRRAPMVLVGGSEDSGEDVRETAEPIDFEARAAAFRHSASQEAWQLAVYLCSSAFTLPVARVVQAAKFRSVARQSHLAEVLLSGILRLRSPADSDPNTTYYEFFPEAAKVLRRALRKQDAALIAGTLEKHVSEYLEKNFGKAIQFRALVRNPGGTFDIPAYAQPFAELGTALLRLPGSQRRADFSDDFAKFASDKLKDSAGLFARGVEGATRKCGPAWAADACNMVDCNEPLWAALLEHGVVVEGPPTQYNFIYPGVLNQFNLPQTNTDSRSPFVFRSSAAFLGESSSDVPAWLDLTNLPYRRAHLIRSADYYLGEPDTADLAIVRRYAIPIARTPADVRLVDRRDPAVLIGVPEPAAAVMTNPADVETMRGQLLGHRAVAVLSSRGYDGRQLVVDLAHVVRREYDWIVWTVEDVPKRLTWGDATARVVEGTPELPGEIELRDLIFLDPHPDLFLWHYDIPLFDGTRNSIDHLPGTAGYALGPVPQTTPGMRYIFDVWGFQYAPVETDLHKAAENQGGAKPFRQMVLMCMRMSIQKLAAEQKRALLILGAVGPRPCPDTVLSQLPEGSLAPLKRWLLIRPAGKSVRISDCAEDVLRDMREQPARKELLDLYRAKFPSTALVENSVGRIST